MEKPNPEWQGRTSPSVTSGLKVISDEKALVLFNNIVIPDNNNGIISLKKVNLSQRQYYSKISGFLKAGLIKRHKGMYIPTLLGRIVYDSLTVIEEALSHYWKLRVIDQIEMSNFGLPTEEVMTRLINVLIDNHRIKEVLMKQADLASVEAKSEP
jgi:hypothetical protein